MDAETAANNVSSSETITGTLIRWEKIPDNSEKELELHSEEQTLAPSQVDYDNSAAILSEMSLEEKVAQIFFVTPEALTGVDQVTVCGDRMRLSIDKRPVGGIVFFSNNLISPEQTRDMLTGIQDHVLSKGKTPVFLGIDEEGGKVARIGNNPSFNVDSVSPMLEIGSTRDVEKAYNAGYTIGSYLYRLGFNLDFAPDADVLTNKANRVIGDRSFGEDPQLVTQMTSAYANGMHSASILTTYKHYPGHGGTEEDTHEGYAYSYKTLEELEASELVPFIKESNTHADLIMVSHITLPLITGDNTPVSLSFHMISNLLRSKYGYSGIIITDALAMGAVSEHYSSANASLLAFKAGCDMLLMPADFDAAYNAILNAVSSGEIPVERLDESVLRILRVKENMNVNLSPY